MPHDLADGRRLCVRPKPEVVVAEAAPQAADLVGFAGVGVERMLEEREGGARNLCVRDSAVRVCHRHRDPLGRPATRGVWPLGLQPRQRFVKFRGRVRRIDKAIVGAAGRGTRMRAPTGATLTAEQAAAADAGAKPLIPVGSARPFLDYSLSALADGGFVRVCLVVAPGDAAIRDRYSSELRLERLEIAFAEQAAARGTADALLAARDFAGDD